MTFDDAECYQLFIAIDNLARAFQGEHPEVNALREKLLPTYRAWHDANPNKVHPSARAAPTGRGAE
jgi:hypothetical protein